jgi:hypothetical protein
MCHSRRGRQGCRSRNEPRSCVAPLFRACTPCLGHVQAIPVDHWTHFACCVAVVHCFPSLCCDRRRLRPEPVDPAQDLDEQGARHCHLGQLEHDVATMAHDPGADLDQLLAQCSQRPVLHPLRGINVWRKLVRLGARVKLEPHRVVTDGIAGQPRQKAKDVLALLNPCSAVVERDSQETPSIIQPDRRLPRVTTNPSTPALGRCALRPTAVRNSSKCPL